MKGTITNPVVGSPSTGASGNAGVNFIQTFVPMAINLAFIVAAIVFFFMLITGGIKWIASGGDKQALEGARGTVTNAIIGLVVVFGTYAIMQLITGFFGIDLFSLKIPTL